MVAQQTHQHRQFLVVGHVNHALAHAVGGDLLGLDLGQSRAVHVLVGQLQNFVRERGGEQVIAALRGRRHLAQQVTDVVNETQVEHAVGFVQHHDLDEL